MSFQLRTQDEEKQKEIKLTEDTLIRILRHFLILNLSPHILNDVKLNIPRFTFVNPKVRKFPQPFNNFRVHLLDL